jgi:hypothetical protein
VVRAIIVVVITVAPISARQRACIIVSRRRQRFASEKPSVLIGRGFFA